MTTQQAPASIVGPPSPLLGDPGRDLKRHPISYFELLRDILPREPLSDQEREVLSRALANREPTEMRQAAQGIVRGLIDRGALEVVEAVETRLGPLLRLRDPERGIRFAIHMESEAGGEGIEVIPLPFTPDARVTIPPDLVRRMVEFQAELVPGDRVSGPREMIQRLEPAIASSLGIDRVILHPIESPTGELWRSSPSEPMSLQEAQLRKLSLHRDHLLHARDYSRLDPRLGALHESGSGLFCGIGEERGGWHAVLEGWCAQPDAFDRQRMELFALLAGQFESLLAHAVRLQAFLFFDYLTGLPNRPYLEDQLEKMIASAMRHKQSFAFCIVDIDDFKNYNTRYGYEGGDRALVTVGCVLKAGLRASDTIARYGGEEFVVLLAPPIDLTESMAIAERLRCAIESEPFLVADLGGRQVSETITVSIGGAIFPEHGAGTREIWAVANRRLLEAKSLGKNRVLFAP